MANSDKNIIITPFVSGVTQPQMKFVGQGNDPIYLKVLDGITGTGATAGGALSVEGSAGQLFSIVNRLGTGSIFSVNDISGIPIIDANANGDISLAGYFGNVGVGLTAPTEKFQVTGNAFVSGLVTAVSGVSAAGSTFSSTTNTLDVIASTDGVGLRIAQAVTGSLSRRGGIRLGRSGTTTANTFMESSIGTFTIYNGVDTTGSKIVDFTATTTGFSGDVTATGLISASRGISAAGGVTFAGDIAVNGGDITTTSATATLYNTTATTVNIGNAASTVNLMGATANTQTGIGSKCYVKTGKTDTTSTAKQEIFRYPSSQFGFFAETFFADLIITANRDTIGTNPNNQITKMLVVSSTGSTINHTEYGNVNTGGNLAVYTAELSGTNVIIYATPTTTNLTAFAVYATLIKGTYGFNTEE